MSDLTTLATPKVLDNALAAVQDPQVPIEDRAAMYGLLYEVKRRIDRALGTYIRKGPTAKAELQAHLATVDGEALGPLYLGWQSFDVTWPCNDEGNWTDAGVQEELELIARISPAFVRHIPEHYELATEALGEAVHAADPVALEIHRQAKERGWRREGGKRAVLKVREVPAPKGSKAA